LEEVIGVAAWNKMSYLVSEISVTINRFWNKIRKQQWWFHW